MLSHAQGSICTELIRRLAQYSSQLSRAVGLAAGENDMSIYTFNTYVRHGGNSGSFWLETEICMAKLLATKCMFVCAESRRTSSLDHSSHTSDVRCVKSQRGPRLHSRQLRSDWQLLGSCALLRFGCGRLALLVAARHHAKTHWHLMTKSLCPSMAQALLTRAQLTRRAGLPDGARAGSGGGTALPPAPNSQQCAAHPPGS